MNIKLNDIKVKIKIIEEKKLQAIISLDFGEFVIKGFRLSYSDIPNQQGDKLWLVPPSYRDSGGHYHPIFFIPDKPKWRTLEELICLEYKKQKEEYHKKRFGLKN